MLNTTLKLLIFLHLFCFSLFSQPRFVICLKEQIGGFDEEYKLAKELCGETTTDVKKSKFYITTKDLNDESAKGEFLYIHSNFRSSIESAYPVKLATDDNSRSFELYIASMYYPGRTKPLNAIESSDVLSKIRNDMEFIIDPSIFDSKKFDVNFIGITKLNKKRYLCPDNITRELEVFYGKNSQAEFTIKYDEIISTRIKNQNLSFIINNLEKKQIGESKILSLVNNSTTKEVLDLKFESKSLSFDFSSIEKFKGILLNNKDKRVIILGHIEDGHFVTLDKDGTEIFNISIEEIQQIQEENDLSILLLGCNSGLEGGKTGVINKFNSVEVLNRLETTEKTKNIREFLDSLGFRVCRFVLDETFFKKSHQSDMQIPVRVDFNLYVKESTNSSKFVMDEKILAIFLEPLSSIISKEASEGDTLKQNSDRKSNADNKIYLIFCVVLVLSLLLIMYIKTK